MSLKLLLVLLVSLVLTNSSIVKFTARKDLQFQRDNQENIPIEEIHDELSARLRRASGTPNYTKNDLQDNNNYGLVHYSGGNSDTIIVLTYRLNNGGSVTTWNLYLSNDYGNSFTKINSRIENGVTLANRIFVSPEDPKRIYFADANEAKIYLSNDEGVTFTQRTFSPNTINTLSLLANPLVEDWVLARSSDNSLYVSRDLGNTPFKKIADNVFFSSDYQWGDKAYDKDDTLVYYNTDSPTQTTNEVDLYTQHYPYDETTRKEFDPLLGPHDGFLMVGRYIFVQKTINGKVTLWVSVDRKPFQQAMIPTPYNHERYIVGNINSLQALVIIKHNATYYNLYMSEENGKLYYLALSDLKVVELNNGANYAIDLEAIASMNYTTYIANQNVRSSPSDTNPSVRTLISYDVGANWEILRPPTGIDSQCIQPQCSLHLHMSTSEYWRTGVYSQESAPGIIIAHGVTGQYLNDDDTNLFISRDGGSTWSMSLLSTWGVSVLDHGGLIVAARDYHNTPDESRTLKYSCNEGLSWSDLTFSLQNVFVYGVIAEPGEATTIVSLYGVQSNGWVVVTVEFRPVFSTVCAVPGDYYNWIPFDDITQSGCLLGAAVTIQRRQPSHCCLNGLNYTRTVSYSICACNEEDFECDYGYEHANGISGPCVRDYDVTLPSTCSDGDVSYLQTQGYHKIGGDVCSGGVESNYLAFEAPCCNVSGGFTITVTRHVVDPPVTSTVTQTSVSITTKASTTVTTTVTSFSTVRVRVSPSSAGVSSSGSGDNSSTISIILGSVLVLAVVVIGVFVVVAIVICVIKKSSSQSGYSRVPIAYHSSDRETSPPIAGVHNINYVDDNDDDDDEKPLPL